MLIVIILTLSILVFLIVEKAQIDRMINMVPTRILVNGTRGKTSTVRLIASALNEAGIKTIAKTTGSEASIIYPDGTITAVNRKRGRNMVREQRLLFKEAVKNGCSAVVCECMAVRPESQIVFSKKLFKPTLVAITNTYTDHYDVMGEHTEEVIMLSVPEGTPLVKGDFEYRGSLDGFRTKFNSKCVGLALKVCSSIGIDEKTAISGMKKAQGDIGITEPLRVGEKTVVNGFSANDTHSAAELLSGYDLNKTTVVFANRSDREFRLQLFKKIFADCGVSDLAVIGDNLFKCRHYLKCRSYKNNEFDQLIKSSRETIVCLGNIVGSGRSFLEFCKGEGK